MMAESLDGIPLPKNFNLSLPARSSYRGDKLSSEALISDVPSGKSHVPVNSLSHPTKWQGKKFVGKSH